MELKSSINFLLLCQHHFFSNIKFKWIQIHLNVLNYIKRGNLYLSQYVKQIIEPFFLLIQFHIKL